MVDAKRSISPLAMVLGLSVIFFIVFLILSGIFFLMENSRGNHSRSGGFFSSSSESIGIVEVNGPILDSKKTLAKLEQFEEMDAVKGVVLRLNSPGGSVAPSQEIYEAVRAFKKPLVVSMGSVAASGAYYIACGAKKVFANAGTLTGSIGVIMEFANIQKLYEWAKVQRYVVKTGKFKDIGAEYRDMTPEEKQVLQTLIMNVLEQFRGAVALGRQLPMKKVVELSDGRIFSGTQAKELGLVDEIGTLKDAVAAVAELAQIKGKPKVVYPEKNKLGWLDFLLDERSSSEDSRMGSPLIFGILEKLLGQTLHLDPGTVTPLPSSGLYWMWRGTEVH
jgi:protease-4